MSRVFLIILGLPFMAFGEDTSGDARQPQGQAIIIQQQSNQSQVPYRGEKIFDDGVFKSVGRDSAPSGPPVSKSVYSGTIRATERDANYNSEQSDRWKRDCKAAQAQDPKLYRECFESRRDEELRAVQARKDAIERRQTSPYRGNDSDPVSQAQGAPGYRDEATE